MAHYLMKNGSGDLKLTKSRAEMARLAATGYRVIELWWK